MAGKDISLIDGTLTEISGPVGGGKTELALRVLAERGNARIAWVEREFTIYPPALARHGIDPSRVFWIQSQGSGDADASKLALWAAQQALASRTFGAVIVAPGRVHDTVALRRLQLAAEKAQVPVILLVEYATAGITWPIRTQIQVERRGDELKVTFLKNRESGLRKLEAGACQLQLG